MPSLRLILPFLVAAVLAGAATAALPPKPYTPSATFCATHFSPATVKAWTGFDATPQKGPAGQCHFIVGGFKDAFQIGAFNLKTPAKAKALLQQGWEINVQDAAACQASLSDPGTPAGTTCSEPQKTTISGSPAVVYDRGPTYTWVWVIRGPQYFSVQVSNAAYLPAAQAEAIMQKVLARVPKYAPVKK